MKFVIIVALMWKFFQILTGSVHTATECMRLKMESQNPVATDPEIVYYSHKAITTDDDIQPEVKDYYGNYENAD
jgi:hypothetical protein